MVKEFVEIKALGGEIKEMKHEISSKANSDDMEAALALKGDLALVNTKVGILEFETAIEELGEAIGLLGIKFQRKNDEWEERAAELWRGVDSKMSRDVFDKAVDRIQERLTALMSGLGTLKNVVEALLYPDSSGVTRCILCRRPAGIAGHECLEAMNSPKWPLKSSTGGASPSDDKDKFMKSIGDAIAKRQKLEGPPFSIDRDTIISVPYKSASYRSSPEEDNKIRKPDLKIAPVDGQTGDFKERKSQVPKLPRINSSTTHSSSKSKSETQFFVPKVRASQQHRELTYTPKVLSRMKKESKRTETKQPILGVEVQPSVPSKPSRQSDIASSTDVIIDPAGNLKSFAPMRLMQDPLRREVIISPPLPKVEQTSAMSLAPLSSEVSPIRESTSS
ncbi:uncharacterized protein TNCT_499101 [Trichonephila clavata]|uniref:DUF4795 domain-containing protein n=1 Tax=Trichonephila clavata TaxID=2740835 RepID=A0A8X6KJE4_TRICU|nr:uncharacterized protein TNCT_499101 [Trichonephila clavata]